MNGCKVQIFCLFREDVWKRFEGLGWEKYFAELSMSNKFFKKIIKVFKQ